VGAPAVTDLRGWLAGRSPAPPDALPLTVPEGEGDPGKRLTDAGAAALERALAGAGERRGAYDLLGADALFTYACEHAATAADPEAELLRVIGRIGTRGG
jgi:hypothetical protein